MSNEEKFITLFINNYYEKGTRKRRSSKRIASNAIKTINKISIVFFDNTKFSEAVILKGFLNNGFTIMDTSENDFTWKRFHKGSPLLLDTIFINFNTDKNIKMKLTTVKTYSKTVKQETITEVNAIKDELRKFWFTNKQFI